MSDSPIAPFDVLAAAGLACHDDAGGSGWHIGAGAQQGYVGDIEQLSPGRQRGWRPCMKSGPKFDGGHGAEISNRLSVASVMHPGKRELLFSRSTDNFIAFLRIARVVVFFLFLADGAIGFCQYFFATLITDILQYVIKKIGACGKLGNANEGENNRYFFHR